LCQGEEIIRQLAIDCLLSGGDDYELCFTASKNKRVVIEQLEQQIGVKLSRIGKIVAGEGLIILNNDGNPLIFNKKGYDHFPA
jgi:thiamine-monophosphate kinase